MRKGQNYDERQILEQGRAYRWGFLAALLTFVLYYVLQECAGLQIDGYTMMISGIWMPLAVCMISQIVRNAYDYVDSATGRMTLSVIGVVGLGLLIYTILKACLWGGAFYRNDGITDQAGFLVMGGCMVLVCLVYWGKLLFNRKRFLGE